MADKQPWGQLGQWSALVVDSYHGQLMFNPWTGDLIGGDNTISVWQMPAQTRLHNASTQLWINRVTCTEESNVIFVTANGGLARVDLSKPEAENAQIIINSGIGGCDYNPDQSWLLTARDKTPCLLDPESFEVVREFKSLRAQVYGVALHPEGHQYATASGKIARLHPLTDPGSADKSTKVISLKGSKRPLLNVYYSPDGRYLVGEDGHFSAYLWDTHTGELLLPNAGRGSQFSPDGQTFYYNGQLSEAPEQTTYGIVSYDLNARRAVHCIQSDLNIWRMSLSPDGSTLAILGFDSNKIELLDLSTEKMLSNTTSHQSHVTDVRLSPKGEHIYTTAQDKRMCQWSLHDDLALQREQRAEAFNYRGLTFSQNGNLFAVKSGPYVEIRRTNDWELLWSWSKNIDTVREVVWFGDDRYLMVLSPMKYKGYARVFFLDVEKQRLCKEYNRINMDPLGAIARDEELTVFCDAGTIVFSAKDHAQLRSLPFTLPDDVVGEYIAISPRGKEALYLEYKTGQMHLVNIHTGRSRSLPKLQEHPISACFLRGGDLLLAVGKEGEWLAINPQTGALCDKQPMAQSNLTDTGLYDRHPTLFPLGDSRVAMSLNDGRISLWSFDEFDTPAYLEPQSNDPFADLREQLQQTPSLEAWVQVCNTMADWTEEPDVLLDYVQTHAASWPDTFRLLPSYWLAELLSGRRQPLAQLARKVHLQDAQLDALKRIAKAKDLKQMTQLHIQGKGVNNAAITKMCELADWPALEELLCHGCNIKQKGTKALAKSPLLQQLKKLALQYTPIGEPGLIAIVEAQHQLEALTLIHCGLKTLSTAHPFAEAFVQASHLSTLQFLELSCEGNMDVAFLARAEQLSNLRVLKLETGYRQQLHQLEPICRAPQFAQLEHFETWGPELSDEQVRSLIEAPFAPQLKVLDISHNATKETSKRLLERCTQLNDESKQMFERH